MKLLLDTHVFLWFISGDSRLPDAMRDNIRDLIKHQLGKLPLPQPPEVYLPAQRERHQISSVID